MRFESAFNINDKIFVIHNNLPARLTIGKIIIEHTDSSGLPDEKLFDNYKPQKKYMEQYMCIETGISTGSIYTLDKNIFKSYDDCLKTIEEMRN